MLHAILLVIVGLISFWLLTAIFETVALKNHRNVARILAAALTVLGAYIGSGYHNWWQVFIGMGVAYVYLQVMKEPQRQSEDKSH